MQHWSQRYVGRPYIEGEFDCGELARTVQREVFGREIALPTERGYMGKKGAEKFRAMAAQIDTEKTRIAERTEAPQEGDAVLLVARGYLQHVGVYCLIGEPWVLHAADTARQVLLARVRELAAKGLRVEGYYRWT
jgi:phosphatidylserine/phosphatidylglycerophosphate/cardiolipin synthase-like enzyme